MSPWNDTSTEILGVPKAGLTDPAFTFPATGAVITSDSEIHSRKVNVFEFLTDEHRTKAKAGTVDYDATYAFHAAIAALPTTGGTIEYPHGKFKANIVVTKDNVRIAGPSCQDTSTGMNYISAWDTAKPALQVGDDTKLLYGFRCDNVSLYGDASGVAQLGLDIQGGVQCAFFNNFSSRNFGDHCIKISGGTSFNTEWIFFNGLIARAPLAGSPITLGCYYGATWLTAVFVDGYKIEGGNSGTSFALLLDSVALCLSHGWMQGSADHGVKLQKTWTPSPSITGIGSTLEFTGASQVGIDVYHNTPRASANLRGDIHIVNGKMRLLNASIVNINTEWAFTSGTELYEPQIMSAYFADSATPQNQNNRVYGSGNDLYVTNANASSSVRFSGTGNFGLGSCNLQLLTLGKNIQVKEGTNSIMGTATLSSGTVTVGTTMAVTGARIFISRAAGAGTRGTSLEYTINNGVGFTVTSKDAAGATVTADTSAFNYLIMTPAP